MGKSVPGRFRLYLRDLHASVPYRIHPQVISSMVKDQMLNVIVEGEGIRD
ncbi:MAG TPA: hypothetical protein VGC87_01490 [Pyrinomonadaceae bacterium]|jgi:hypothetical protein